MRGYRMSRLMAGVVFALLLSVNGSGSASAALPREVVFIDPWVEDAAMICAQLPARAEVVHLQPGRDGLAQISAVLSEKRNLSAIHILSHGGPGILVLNQERVDQDVVDHRADEMALWGRSLAREGDILLYGCHIGAGAAGKGLIGAISRLTGRDVAASANLTGKGGDWDLEALRGRIEADPLRVYGYPHHLADQVVTLDTDNFPGGGGEPGDLRYAIANVGDGETITFNISGSDTVTISAELAISGKGLTINGTNAATGNPVTVQVTIPGVSLFRVFNIDAASKTVTISHMSVKGGDIHSLSAPAWWGGGIYLAAGTLNLDSVTVWHSRAKNGGGIHVNSGAELTLTNSTLSGNTADLYGGGICNWEGTLTLTDTTISGNTGAVGGGICNLFGTLTLTNSIISGNTAISDGGGIYSLGTLTVTGSTISGNTANNAGGGLFILDASALIQNATIAGNTATLNGGGIVSSASSTVYLVNTTVSNNEANGAGSRGGGLFNSETFYLLNTLVVNNTADGTGGDIETGTGKTTTAYYSWYQYAGGEAVAGNALAPNRTDAYTAGDLGALADNGGPTQTMALLNPSCPAGYAGSYGYYNATDGYYLYDTQETPAAHKLSDWDTAPSTPQASDKITTDQRGAARHDTPAMGAYEFYGDYVTNGAGIDWGTAANWNRDDGFGFVGATQSPTADNSRSIAVNHDMTVDANVTIDQTTVAAGKTLTVTGGVTLTVADGDGMDLDLNGTLVIADGADVDCQGGFDATGGAVTFTGDGALILSGDVVSLGTLTAGEGTVGFAGTTAQTLTGSNTFYDLVIDKDNATDEVNATGSTLAVTNGLSVTRGVFTSASSFHDVVISPLGTLNLSGDITVSGDWMLMLLGTFNHNNHTVTLDGADQYIFGSTTFYKLTKQVGAAATLEFESDPDSTTTIVNTLTLEGAAGQLLSLRSDDPGHSWNIDPRGTRNIAYVDVQDSSNVNTTAINAQGTNSRDSGNNTNWVFDPAVTYNGNGNTAGTAPTDPNSPYAPGDSVTVLGNTGNLVKTGSGFNNWNTQAGGGGTAYNPGDTFAMPTTDVTLYAQWTLNTYPVTYNANGATSGTAPAGQTKTYGVDLTLRTNSGNLARTGYTYAGWNTAADGSGTNYAAGGQYTANAAVTLYAKWTATTYTVTFDANGGTAASPATKQVSYGGTYGDLATTTRDGYTFNGWFTAATGGTQVTSGTTVTTASDHTLYARWIVQPPIPTLSEWGLVIFIGLLAGITLWRLRRQTI